MKKPAVTPAIYKKLIKFATANGKPALIGTVIGSLDEPVIQAYLAHMKATDPALFKKWGSKYAPAPEEEDEDDDPTADLDEDDDADPTADLEDETPPERQKTPVAETTGKKEKTAGLDELFDDKPAPSPPKKAPAVPAGVPPGHMLIDGVAYPQRFRLRGANGLDTELEVYSKNPNWGVIVRVPVPTDMRKIMLPGGEVEVDMLVLRRDPDGMTTLNGKKYANSRLIAAAELQEDG